jgi:heme-degrading monooxygenase HmoA
VVRILRLIVLPAAEGQPGFAGLVVMSDREAYKVLSTSLWYSEAEMLASEEAEYFQEQISRLITLLSGPPIIEHCEVDAVS